MINADFADVLCVRPKCRKICMFRPFLILICAVFLDLDHALSGVRHCLMVGIGGVHSFVLIRSLEWLFLGGPHYLRCHM